MRGSAAATGCRSPTSAPARAIPSFGATYVELTPHERIRYTEKFDDPNLPGEMQVTITLRTVLCGTELAIVQEGIPAAVPVEMCSLGWQESLAQLAHIVEPQIPDGT